jgi:hypothetical protein
MSFQAYLDTIDKKTGLTARQLVDQARAKGFDASTKATPILAWLADAYGLGRGHGMALVHVITRGDRISNKHVDDGGSHADASDTLWLDGAATNPHR